MILCLEFPGWEARLAQGRHPELAGRPVVVCRPDPTGRARILAASPEAQACGVRDGMGRAEAAAACPRAAFVAPDPREAVAAFRRLTGCLGRFSGRVETAGASRVYLELPGGEAPHGVLEAVEAAVGLPPRAGWAATKILARAAARLAADGQCVPVEAGGETRVLDVLPVRALWGVDLRTEACLHARGLTTAGELARVPRQELEAWFGPQVGASLWEQARGVDRRGVVPFVEPPRVEVAETVTPPSASREVVAGHAGQLTGRLARALGAERPARVGLRVEAVSGAVRQAEGPPDDLFALGRLLERIPLEEPVETVVLFAELG
ncbi:MAG: DNA polymerase IV [Deferrisomatales bacterium]